MVLPRKLLDREYERFTEDSNGQTAVRMAYNAFKDAGNSTTATLAGDATYTGTWINVAAFPSVMVACKADVAGTMFMEFNNTSSGAAQSTLAYDCSANITEVHRLSVTREFFRVRYTNGSSAQSSFELTALVGHQNLLSAPLNLTLGQDADAITVRAITSEIDIAENKRAGYKLINIYGENTDIDTATVPEDLWAGGGAYTGFPIGTTETVDIVSSSTNDTSAGTGARTVDICGLDANGDEQTETLTMNGTSPVTSSNTWTRVNVGIVKTSGNSNQNLNDGTITVRHTTTSANVFMVIPAASNHSRVSSYTVPAGKTAFVRFLGIEVNPNNTGKITGSLWIRPNGESPRLERPFYASESVQLNERIYGGLKLEALTDFSVRVESSSANNMAVKTNVDIVLVDN